MKINPVTMQARPQAAMYELCRQFAGTSPGFEFISSALSGSYLQLAHLGLLRKAVVSTSLGMQGIDGAQAGKHFLAADDPRTFADAVLALVNAPGQCARMGQEAHDFVRRHYSWDAAGERWAALLEATVTVKQA